MNEYLEILQKLYTISKSSNVGDSTITLKFDNLKIYIEFKNHLSQINLPSEERVVSDCKQSLHLIILLSQLQKINESKLNINSLLKQKEINFES